MVKEIFPEKIKITSVRLLSGSIECPQAVAITNPTIFNCATNFFADFRFNTAHKTGIYYLTVSLQALGANQEPIPITANYSFEVVFTVDNLQDYIVSQSPSGILIENVLASTLMGITYSTIRGIILSRTEGTILKGIILPIVDPKSLITHKIIQPA